MYVDIKKEIKNKDYIQEMIDNEFKKSIVDNMFFVNIDLLRLESDVYDFKKDWDQNPKKASLSIYGKPYYFKIILLTNNVPSYFLFKLDNMKTILAPNISTINNIISTINL